MELNDNLDICLDQFHPAHSLISYTLINNALLLVVRWSARVSYDALCLFPQNDVEFLSKESELRHLICVSMMYLPVPRIGAHRTTSKGQ